MIGMEALYIGHAEGRDSLQGAILGTAVRMVGVNKLAQRTAGHVLGVVGSHLQPGNDLPLELLQQGFGEDGLAHYIGQQIEHQISIFWQALG